MKNEKKHATETGSNNRVQRSARSGLCMVNRSVRRAPADTGR